MSGKGRVIDTDWIFSEFIQKAFDIMRSGESGKVILNWEEDWVGFKKKIFKPLYPEYPVLKAGICKTNFIADRIMIL